MTITLKFDTRTSVNRALDYVKYGAETMYGVAKGAGIRQETVKKYNEDRKKINTMPLETAEKLQMYYIGHQAAHRLNIDEIMESDNQKVKNNALGEIANEIMKNSSQEMLEDPDMSEQYYNYMMMNRGRISEEESIAYAKERKVEFDIAGNIVDVDYK